MVALRTPDCLQTSLPAGTLGGAEKTNEEFAAEMRPMFGVLTNFNSAVLSVTHDTEAGRSVVHARTSGDTAVGPYKNEHVMIFSFAEDGKKISKVEDMMDSAFVLGLQARMAEFFQQK